MDQLYAHGEKARVEERYRLTQGPDGATMLVAEMTLTDSAFYSELVKAERKWTLVPNGHLLPYDCNEEVWLRCLEELEVKANTQK